MKPTNKEARLPHILQEKNSQPTGGLQYGMAELQSKRTMHKEMQSRFWMIMTHVAEMLNIKLATITTSITVLLRATFTYSLSMDYCPH